MLAIILLACSSPNETNMNSDTVIKNPNRLMVTDYIDREEWANIQKMYPIETGIETGIETWSDDKILQSASDFINLDFLTGQVGSIEDANIKSDEYKISKVKSTFELFLAKDNCTLIIPIQFTKNSVIFFRENDNEKNLEILKDNKKMIAIAKAIINQNSLHMLSYELKEQGHL